MNKMYHLHKEKERIRHHKQIELLDEVFKHVPKLDHEVQTKVRKLRRLVIYRKYMQMMHQQISKGHHKINSRKVLEKAVNSDKSLYETIEVKKKMKHKQKASRAHIVFLQSDRSATHNKNIQNMNHETYCNLRHSVSNSPESEYKIPEALPVHYKMNTNNARFCLPDFSTFTAEHTSEECGKKAGALNHCEIASSESEITVCQDPSGIDKENIYLVDNENSTTKSKDTSYEDSYFHKENTIMQNIVSNSKTADFDKKNDHEFINNSVLKDITFSNTEIGCFNNSDIIAFNGNEAYFSHHFNSFLTEHESNLSGYDYHHSHDNVYQNCKSTHNVMYSDILSVEPLYSNHRIEIPENVFDRSGSSTSTERLHIDIENLSDSYPSCSNATDDSVSYNPKDFVNDSDLSTTNSSTKSPTVKKDSPHKGPMLTDYNYLRGNILANDKSYPMYDMAQPYFDTFYHANFNLNKNPGNSIFVAPLQSLPVSMTFSQTNIGDSDSFYSSPVDGFQFEEYFTEQNPDKANSNFSELLTDIKLEPYLPKDEVFCSLAEYFSRR